LIISDEIPVLLGLVRPSKQCPLVILHLKSFRWRVGQFAVSFWNALFQLNYALAILLPESDIDCETMHWRLCCALIVGVLASETPDFKPLLPPRQRMEQAPALRPLVARRSPTSADSALVRFAQFWFLPNNINTNYLFTVVFAVTCHCRPQSIASSKSSTRGPNRCDDRLCNASIGISQVSPIYQKNLLDPSSGSCIEHRTYLDYPERMFVAFPDIRFPADGHITKWEVYAGRDCELHVQVT
jgi:hypothetical protein